MISIIIILLSILLLLLMDDEVWIKLLFSTIPIIVGGSMMMFLFSPTSTSLKTYKPVKEYIIPFNSLDDVVLYKKLNNRVNYLTITSIDVPDTTYYVKHVTYKSNRLISLWGLRLNRNQIEYHIKR